MSPNLRLNTDLRRRQAAASPVLVPSLASVIEIELLYDLILRDVD